jgi:hypothetical protein
MPQKTFFQNTDTGSLPFQTQKNRESRQDFRQAQPPKLLASFATRQSSRIDALHPFLDRAAFEQSNWSPVGALHN